MVTTPSAGTTTQLPAWATTTSDEELDFTQIEALVRDAGGTTDEAVVGAGIAEGVESGGQTQVLAGGVGPAQGLWQFEPTTWEEFAPQGAPPTAGGATPIQQAEAFVSAVTTDQGYAPWAPDLGYPYPDDPTAPAATSPVANYLATDPAGVSTASWTSILQGLSGAGAIGTVVGDATTFLTSGWKKLATELVLVGLGGTLIVFGLYKAAGSPGEQSAKEIASPATMAAAAGAGA